MNKLDSTLIERAQELLDTLKDARARLDYIGTSLESSLHDYTASFGMDVAADLRLNAFMLLAQSTLTSAHPLVVLEERSHVSDRPFLRFSIQGGWYSHDFGQLPCYISLLQYVMSPCRV